MAVIKINQSNFNTAAFSGLSANSLLSSTEMQFSNFRALFNASIGNGNLYFDSEPPPWVEGTLTNGTRVIYLGANLFQSGTTDPNNPLNPASPLPNTNPTITTIGLSPDGTEYKYFGNFNNSGGRLTSIQHATSPNSFGSSEANGSGLRGNILINAAGEFVSGSATEISFSNNGEFIKVLGSFVLDPAGSIASGTVTSISFGTLKLDPSGETYFLYDAADFPIANTIAYSATGLSLDASNFFTTTWGQITTLAGGDLSAFQALIGGLNGNDNITGSAGNDTLDGGLGVDVMTGGKGNDLYIVDNIGDKVVETFWPEEGNGLVFFDTIRSSVSYTLISNVEYLVLTGSNNINGTAYGSGSHITGNSGNNILKGSTGGDTLIGMEGDDTYIATLSTATFVDGTNPNKIIASIQDTIGEYANMGNDTLILNGSISILDRTKISLTFYGYQPNWTPQYLIINNYNTQNIENFDISQTGLSRIDLEGSDVDNKLIGNAFSNIILGLAGNDTLDGGVGADSMDGGSGDDTFYIDNVGDVITDSDGVDTAIIRLASGAYVLAAGSDIENISIGNTAALNLTGNNTANRLTGNAAANILDGGTEADVMVGGDGADTYIVDDAGDVVTETNALAAGGIDLVKSSVNFDLTTTGFVENLTLTGNDEAGLVGIGNALANTIIGDDGNNTFDGREGKDILKGGKGDDFYYVDVIKVGTGATATIGLQDTVTENLNEGFRDEIRLQNRLGSASNAPLNAADFSALTTLTLGANIENLYADSLADFRINLTGNTLDNVLDGNNTDNVLLGLAGNDGLGGFDGNDTLDGGAGVDFLSGGTGDDTYIVDLTAPFTQITYGAQSGTFNRSNLQDDVVEFAGEGIDTLKIRGTFSNTSPLDLIASSYYNNVEGLDISLTGTAKINLTGDSANNNLVGNAGTNAILGGDGNDMLDGGAGIDLLQGGNGDDTYVVDNISDNVSETGSGNDTIRSSLAINLNSTISATDSTPKYANIENVTLTGLAALNITGNTGNNLLIGNDGANIIDGGGGSDQMEGGKGNDTYIVSDQNDSVIETLTQAQGGGIDTVRSNDIYQLGDNVENLTLTGTGNINGDGNELANTIIGNAGNNILTGRGGIDALTGGNGSDDYIIDIARVGTGATATIKLQDTVTEGVGLAGDIDFIALTNNTGGIPNGNPTGVGLNAADFSTTTTFTLAANIEGFDAGEVSDFKLNITGNTGNNELYGNNTANVLLGLAGNDELFGDSGDDTLDGGIGIDTLEGGDGSDTYIVDMVLAGTLSSTTFTFQDTIVSDESGTDTLKLRGAINYGTFVQTLNVTDYAALGMEGIDISLTGTTRFNLNGNDEFNNLVGNAFANTITAGLGNDTLDGGAGNDSMDGGDGDDTYVIDSALDVITDNSGTDTVIVKFGTSYTLANVSVIENVTLGSTLANLNGNNSDNQLRGNDLANIIDGKGGIDFMFGGKGNDTYITDGNDIIVEGENGGIDLVKSSQSFLLGNQLENLTLTDGTATGGTANLDGTGNELANILIGNAGDNELFGESGNDTLTGGAGSDALNGGLGNDVLNGGAGQDFFTFDSELVTITSASTSVNNKDTIQGFNHAEDTIELSQAIFSSLSLGTLNADNYRVGAAALDANDFIINNAGNLYYDADGNGTIAAVQFATLTGTVGIVGVDDFVVF